MPQLLRGGSRCGPRALGRQRSTDHIEPCRGRAPETGELPPPAARPAEQLGGRAPPPARAAAAAAWSDRPARNLGSSACGASASAEEPRRVRSPAAAGLAPAQTSKPALRPKTAQPAEEGQGRDLVGSGSHPAPSAGGIAGLAPLSRRLRPRPAVPTFT